MPNHATRLLSLILILQSRPTWKAGEIAAELDVSERTVHRYMSDLEEMGIPIYTERGPCGGFGLLRGYRLPPMVFTAEEATVLTMGANLVRQLWGQTYQDTATAALAKLHKVLPDDLRQEIAEAQQSLHVAGLTAPSPRPWEPTLHTLRAALTRRQVVQCEYLDASLEMTEREIDPYALVFTMGYWYLIAYCHLRQAQRFFRVDRILHPTLLKQSYTIPADFSVKQYLQEASKMSPRDPAVIHLDPVVAPLAKERFGHWLPIEMHEDGSATARFEISNLEWTIGWALSWGSMARVLAPDYLVKRVQEEAEAIVKRYQDVKREP